MKMIYTIGVSGKSLENFIKLLKSNAITEIRDIRRKNDSQLLGFARMRDLKYILAMHGIKYIHNLELAPSEGLLGNYRKSKNWEEYEIEFKNELESRDLEGIINEILDNNENIAFLCSEDKPDKCHRRLVVEFIKRYRPELEIIHIK